MTDYDDDRPLTSYGELKRDIDSFVGFIFGLVIVLAVLAAFGSLVLVIGLPEVLIVGADPTPAFDGDALAIVERGGFFSAVGLLAAYGLLCFEITGLLAAWLGDREMRDVLPGLGALNIMAGVASVVLLAGKELRLFYWLGLLVAAAVRWLLNPLICLLWASAGVYFYKRGEPLLAVLNFFAIPLLVAGWWLGAAILRFLFASV